MNDGPGADGDDSFVRRDTTDKIIEAADMGTDRVQSLLETTTLADNVEKLEIQFVGSNWAYGNALDNTMTGNEWFNALSGDLGDDTLYGMAGNDALYGSYGRDMMDGGVGDDNIRGGEGADKLYGGDGQDHFVFITTTDSSADKTDRIMDFIRGLDKIDLSGIDANALVLGNQAFNYSLNQPSEPSAGDLYFRSGPDGGVLEGDVNGDGFADLRILLTNVGELQAGDFIL